MFSPYYAWTRRRGAGDPAQHCAVNVVLYGGAGKRWAMTERGRDTLQRDRTHLAIGPSSLAWDGDTLTVRIDEITAPIPSRIRGTVRVHPGGSGGRALTRRVFALDAAGLHRWSPLAPCARVEVALDRPGRHWSGPGYLDTNHGDAPMEDTFARWHWSRARLPDGSAAVLYDTTQRNGVQRGIAVRVDPSGTVADVAPPQPAALPRTFWHVARETRADAGHAPRVQQTLEDAPFYARSVLSTRLLGQDVTAMHESLSLDRFRAPWVQAMLPFKMPRALW